MNYIPKIFQKLVYFSYISKHQTHGDFYSKILFLSLIFFTSSCFSRYDSDPIGTAPRKNIINMDHIGVSFDDDLKNASAEFRQGWHDGCETGMHSGDNSFYKMFFKSNKQDGWKMVNSKDYRIAWNYSYWICYRSEYIDQKSSVWGSMFSGFK